MSESSSAEEAKERTDERADKIEKELVELKTRIDGSSAEMGKTVDELRKAVVDIRSAVSEIENPFNLLRAITDEKDLDKMKGARAIIEKKREAGDVEETREESAEEGEKVKEPPTSLKEVGSLLSFKHGVSLVRWIYAMLDLGFEGENLRSVCEYCEYLGLIPSGSSPYVSNMADAIIKTKSKGLQEEEVILSMYTAAESAGAKVSPSDIVECVFQVLRRTNKKNKKMVE